MFNALLCVEVVAMMILGKEQSKYFPRSYLLIADRFQKTLTDATRSEQREKIK